MCRRFVWIDDGPASDVRAAGSKNFGPGVIQVSLLEDIDATLVRSIDIRVADEDLVCVVGVRIGSRDDVNGWDDTEGAVIVLITAGDNSAASSVLDWDCRADESHEANEDDVELHSCEFHSF